MMDQTPKHFESILENASRIYFYSPINNSMSLVIMDTVSVSE